MTDTPSTSRDTLRPPVGDVLHRCRKSFYFVAGISVVVEMLSLAPIIYMWNMFDRVMSSRNMTTLVSLTVLVVAVYLFWSALEVIRSKLMVRLSLRLDWDLAANIFDAAFRRRVGRKNIDIHEVLGDLLALRQFLSGKGAIAIMEAPFALVFIIVGAMFHPYLAVFTLVASAIMLATTISQQKVSTPALKAANNAQNESSRLASTYLRHSEATLALGMLPAARRRWYQGHRKFLQLQVNASEASNTMQGLSSFLNHNIQSLQMALGVILYIQGLITGGMVIAATMLISKSIGPLQQLVGHWGEIVRARQAYDRLNLLLKEDGKRAEAMRLPAPTGALNVTALAGVPPGAQKPVVYDIQFSLQPGQALAIVGPSASGKTSLSKLLMGVWKPARGSVRLDGVEISEWNHDELGPNLGYVPQEIEFFEGTVAENIARLGTVDPDKVVAAAKLVALHETILSWPKGYDTPLGDTGFSLSGGQRQRLAIARALYGDPKFVVLDEPNANLDEIGEQSLIQAIRHLRERKATVIVTTHRPRLIGVVDLMLVLNAGRQVGFGPPKDLFESAKRTLADAAAKKNGEGAPVPLPAPQEVAS
jgi:PrtD family type I secretion system ABC transporter